MHKGFSLNFGMAVLFTLTGFVANIRVAPLSTFSSCNDQNQIPVAECEALVALYNNTLGVSWVNNSGWLSELSPCDWYGIVCSQEHVTKIKLSSNNLNGSIPSGLGNLSGMQWLYLTGNPMSGSIPPDLGNLASLQGLYLSNNQLSGSIPPELGSLTSLQWLNLSDNQLSGSIPPELGNLTGLLWFSLYKNQLNGSIPAELDSLTSLVGLSLNNNQLNGSLPPELGNLTSLTCLLLYDNQLSGSLPGELGNLTNLQTILLYDNQLSGDIPASLANLVNLSYLDLGYNRLTASDPALISFLAVKDANWDQTQTNPPDNFQVTPQTCGALLSWTPIPYTGDGGYYEIYYADVSGGPYTFHGHTSNKSASSYFVSGLSSNGTYYFALRTYTPAHGDQQNELRSEYTPEVTATVPIPSAVLLVDDDDNNPDVRSYYTAALDALGVTYDVWDTNSSDNEPDMPALTPYKKVIWFTGHAFSSAAGPGTSGEAALGAWLDNDNCLFISSQDYLWARGGWKRNKPTSFMASYLGVSAGTSDVSQTVVTGVGDVFVGLGPYTLNYPFKNYSDQISPDGTARPAFLGNRGYAAISKDNGVYKAAFLGFPLDALPDAAARLAVVGRFVDWCEGTLIIPHKVYLPIVTSYSR